MGRKQVILKQQQIDIVSGIAKDDGMSFSKALRIIIVDFDKSTRKKRERKNRLTNEKLARLVRFSGSKPDSQDIDKILYGENGVWKGAV